MGKALTSAELEHFAQDGYLPARRLATREQAADWRRQLEALEQQNGGRLHGALRYKAHLLFKWLADLIRSPALLDPIEDLIGPDILVWSTDWWIKEPRSSSFVSWHQDSQYWGLDTDRLVTAWLALSPATTGSGCIRLLPGSHRGPDLEHDETFHDDNMLSRGQSIRSVDESRAVNLEVDTGEIGLFAFRLAHASHPNMSDDRRIGMAIRLLPPDARQVKSDFDSATLVRGADRHGHFELEPEPAMDFDPITMAYHRRVDEHRRALLYQGTGRSSHRT